MTHEDQTTPAPVEVTALKPCPVCGNAPKWRGSQHDYIAGIYRLQCLGETHLFQSYGATEAICIAAWNTRHSAPAGEVEPVAWMYTHPKCTSYWRTQPDEGHAEDGWTETPLYTHPAPLADLMEALKRLLEEYVSNIDSHRLGGFYLDPEKEECVVEARAALAKHGGA